MLKNFVIAFVVSATMIGTSRAFWQEAAPNRSNPTPELGSRSSPTVTLLGTREVQTELKLEEDKAKKIDAISAESTRERARLAAEYNVKLSELNKKSADEALALLSDAQRQRIEAVPESVRRLRPRPFFHTAFATQPAIILE